MFEGEMLIKFQNTTLLQIFCEIMVISIVISKSILGADDFCKGDQQALMS